MPVSIIVAHDSKLGIGLEGDLPWRGKIPADMERFRRLTLGHTVVMGRKTYESIGRPLPERENVIVTRNRLLSIEGVAIVNSFEEALEVNLGDDELFVIGGSTLYNIALPYTDRLYITRIQAEFEADTFFVGVDETEWWLKDYVMRGRDETNEFNLEFRTYERKKSH